VTVPLLHSSLNGIPIPIYCFPVGNCDYQVGIFYGPDGSFLCSGTLISREHILTAGVCLASIEARTDLSLRIGDWDISEQDSVYEAYKEFRTVPKKVIFLEGNRVIVIV